MDLLQVVTSYGFDESKLFILLFIIGVIIFLVLVLFPLFSIYIVIKWLRNAIIDILKEKKKIDFL